jgi:hypothetical protein
VRWSRTNRPALKRREIAALRKQIAPPDLAGFLAAKNASDPSYTDDFPLRTRILDTVLAYLYSGREAQARSAFNQMWPDWDRERVWRMILETRDTGLRKLTQ